MKSILLVLAIHAGPYDLLDFPPADYSLLAEEPTPPERVNRLLYFTGESCLYCRLWDANEKPKLEKAGVSIGTGNHNQIQRIELRDANRAIFEQYDIKVVPSFVWVERGKWKRRVTGYTSAESVRLLMDEK